ncbi:MAG: hypothetical protein HZB32_07235 [Nitrospirae bacterium]|nr:hypothetical protein [Nitrospirota bacterium]
MGDSEGFTLTVNNINRAPILAPIGNRAVDEGVALNVLVSASDPDGGSLTFGATGLPSFCGFTNNLNNTGNLACSPGYADAGVYTGLTIIVNDGTLTDSETFSLTVNNVSPAIEVCDGIDNNLNGQIDEGFPDTDGDGQADCVDTDDDNDGYSDATEIAAGSDPLNAASTPEVCDGIDNDLNSGIDEGFPAGNTSCGSDVNVVPDGVTFTFPSVTLSGNTTVTTSGTGQPPPSGFKLGATPTYYEIASTATFTGPVEVCINYDETQFATERSMKLFHWNGSGWDNITTSLDTTANIICGNTTSFSPFIVAEESSTAVTLSALSAHIENNQAALTWSTSSETNNEGFVVLRGESAGGPFAPITSSMIPAMGGPGMKATYSFTDSDVGQGKTYYYRLQDVDSRGVVTTHNVIPVTTVMAGGEKPSQKIQEQKQDIQSIPPTLILPRKGGGDDGSGPVVPTSEWRRDAELEIASPDSVSLAMTSRTEGAHIDSSIHPHPASPVKGEEYSESPVVALHAQGPSSFSVSIEDDKGNIIMVSRVEDTEGTSTSTSDLMITNESDRLVLTWQGKGKVKGFILHRAEKGKDNYTAISNLIPYFGRDDKDIFLYRFTDNTTKLGVKYDYRLERVSPEFKMGRRD